MMSGDNTDSLADVSGVHPAGHDDATLLRECQVQRKRASGPGGQHRNKVETAVRLVHTPSGTEATASERRSQAQNLSRAAFRLRIKLAVGIRQPAAMASSELWKDRCKQGKVRINPNHRDFPTLLAEALDVVAASGMEVRQAANRLGCSPTQLVRFFKLEPAAIAWVNDERKRAGLGALH